MVIQPPIKSSQRAALTVAGHKGKNWGGENLSKILGTGSRLDPVFKDRQGMEQPPGLVCMSVTAKKQQCSAVAGFREGEWINKQCFMTLYCIAAAWAADDNSTSCKCWYPSGQRQPSDPLETAKAWRVHSATQGPVWPGAYQVHMYRLFSISILIFFHPSAISLLMLV